MDSDFNIMVGGEAGQGVQSVGAILAASLARGGLNVFADQDYESRIRGGHNFFRVRAKNAEVLALSPELDMLVALNKETIDLHEKELKAGGVVIYDAEQTKFHSDKDNFLNVPLLKLALEKAGNKLMVNTVAAGAALGLAGHNFEILSAVLSKEYGRHGEKIVQDNITAARAGYDYAREHGKTLSFLEISPQQKQNKKLLLNGNEALCLGAMAAGCKFVAGYPMTPSSPILEYMADKGRQYGVVMLHVEDEIAAMNMAVGAGYTGIRAMVATSGGGFALMVEGLALAGMTETPVVIVLGQRPGPATGLPTRTEQAELFFALHAGHGEFPRAVLAPADAADAFSAAVKAFNLAEQYQTPVIILTDNHLATSYYTVDRFDLSQVKIDRGALLSDEEVKNLTDYKRHLVTDSGISPRALPGQGKALVVTDSDEHDEAGHMIEDAATRKSQVEKRLRKQDGLKTEITESEFRHVDGADITLIGWGSTYGAIREAADILQKDGRGVNTLHLSQLWPFPSESVISSLKKARKNIVVEGNATSQLAALIRRETGQKVDGSILKYDGRPFSPREIVDRLRAEVKAW
jgi:2-oxoglutarate/2-oxoacid ferredoxin oxidoreductase subunit alpha